LTVLTATLALPGRALRLARRHWVLTVLLVLGLTLRVMATLAYYPAMLYIDSYGYIQRAYQFDPTTAPMGYSWFLRALLDIGNLTTVVVVQHLFGLAMAVAIYALLRHHDVRRALAALAVAPVLLDGYQVQIEQNIMSDTLFETLVVAGIVTLAWSRRPRLWAIGVGSLLLGCVLTVRNAGDALVAVVLIFPLVAVRGWRRKIAAFVVAAVGFAMPVVAYAKYYETRSGQFGLSSQGSTALYGRAATIANCQTLPLSADEKLLCPTEPLGARYGIDYYVSAPTAPLGKLNAAVAAGTVHVDVNHVADGFALVVIENQPWDFTKAVVGDFLHGFTMNNHVSASEIPASRWQFQTSYPVWPPGFPMTSATRASNQFGQGTPSVQPTLASILRDYQLNGGSTPGPLLGACALLAVGGGLAWSRRVRQSGLRPLCLLVGMTGLGLLFTADVYEYSLRYQLPGLVLLPAAGAVGLTALTWYRKPLLTPYPDDVDAAAAAAFRDEYDEPKLAPVTVVIAAYNERDTIAAVLKRVPRIALGMPVDTLVIVDGASDDTAASARATGAAYVCDVPVNRGQGAALRLGYALARAGGARYVVTTDADGQYDIEAVDQLLGPLVDGDADFVTGSRILGHQQTNDLVRRSGVHVFARLISLLTRHRVTDTSFGLRAMRAEVTATVTLEQPQYQSSELLISTLAHGYRVLELPMLMRVRASGRSKKGNNLVYGARYARVVLRTWWRERRRATPSAEREREPSVA
jgi:hypothetical protein